jgi:hypothetical protein
VVKGMRASWRKRSIERGLMELSEPADAGIIVPRSLETDSG